EGQRAVRDGGPITAAGIRGAVEGSLKRLKTDVIDLYQLHLPNRGSYHFRQNWKFDASGQAREATVENMLEVLREIGCQVDAGKIRHFGLSNESAWGTAKWLQLALDNGLPRAVSIQNEYSLLCRHFDTDLAELSHHEDVGLLAFSPLAAGLLSGKYGHDLTPPGTRRSISEKLSGRIAPRVWGAIDAYLEVAARHGLDPVQMAIAWCAGRPFMTSAIIGATSMKQLETNLGASDLTLSQEVLDDIVTAFKRHPMPF
ncbi:MAG: aldo/keto reductase, partial [Marinosulfonomonas sp.]|nr:aldo/keto reductase [Marinosulfonomonas sp.]